MEWEASIQFEVCRPEVPPVLRQHDVSARLTKWDLHRGLRVRRFRFNRAVGPGLGAQFAKAFFNSAVVQETLAAQSTSSDKETKPLIVHGNVVSAKCTAVPTTLVTTHLFDRLEETGAVRAGGIISKCFEQQVQGFTVADCLRESLLCEESEHYEHFSADERRELLFRLLQHLALGGSLNQYEDHLGPYLDTVRALYKNLLSVQKIPQTQQIEVTTEVYAMEELRVDAGNGLADLPLYPTSSPQNFCYLLLDVAKRQVTVLYHVYESHW